MMKQTFIKAFLVVTAVCLGVTGFNLENLEAREKRVVFGNITTTTGGAARIGIPVAAGRSDHFNSINEKGGIYGYKIHTPGPGGVLDCKHQIDEETRHFNRLVIKENALASIAWGTNTALALKDRIQKEGMVWLSQSAAEVIVDPVKYPYTFIFAPTYTDQQKIAMNYVKSKGAKTVVIVRNDKTGWKVAVDNVLRIKYAEKIGLEVKEVIIQEANVKDATSHMLRAKKVNADYVLSPNEIGTMIPTIRDGLKAGIDPNRIVGTTIWSAGSSLAEILYKSYGKDSNGYTAVQTYPRWDSGVKLIQQIRTYMEAHPDSKKYMNNDLYTCGWMQATTFTKALEAVLAKNNGKAPDDLKDFRKQFRDALENLKGPIFGDDLPDIDYSNHKGWVVSYMVRLEDGKFKQHTKPTMLK